MPQRKRKFGELGNGISTNVVPPKKRRLNDHTSALPIKKTFARRKRRITTKHLQKCEVEPISDSNSDFESNHTKRKNINKNRKYPPLKLTKKVQSTLDFPIKKAASKQSKWNKCGPSKCSDCGMLYYVGRKEDDSLHSKFHKSFIDTFNNGYKPLAMHKFIVWNFKQIAKNAPYFIKNEKKKENRNYKQMKINCKSLEVIHLKSDKNRKDLVLCIKYNEFIELRSKYPDSLCVVDIMDRELGSFTTSQLKQNDNEEIVHSLDENQSLYCFVERSGHIIVGCIICESREFAYKIKIKKDDEYMDMDNVERNDSKEKCYLGIVKIWVHHEFRRRNIASLLVDCARFHSIYGTEIDKKYVAFCQPTRIGQIFAQKYCKTRHILVY